MPQIRPIQVIQGLNYRMRLRVIVASFAILTATLTLPQVLAATPVIPGKTCTNAKQVVQTKGLIYTCVKVGKKLVWSKGVPTKDSIPASTICSSTTATPHKPKTVPIPVIDRTKTLSEFTLHTNCGDIVIDTSEAKAPITKVALSHLASLGYYDNSLCHRLTTKGIFVLQCGDPTATGTGGPGFSYPDENLPQKVINNYPAGTVAMANSGPNTNGSQFFLVYGDTTLNPDYSIWGKITSGIDILKYVASKGVQGGGSDGSPIKFSINSVSMKFASTPLPTPSPTPTPTPTPSPTPTPTVTSASNSGNVTCSATRATGHTPISVPMPDLTIPSKLAHLTLHTNCGDIVINTSGVNAPKTLTAISQLASHHFYDDSLCHRLTTKGIFVLQCGDPTATGSGGPGFSYPDENLPQGIANNYPEGTVAMANSGPNTNGSQFFLVYADTTLNPNYTIWGKISSGLNIVKYIASRGVQTGGDDGAPIAVSINSIDLDYESK